MEEKWNACLQTLESHCSSVRPVAFSHDAARLVSASEAKRVKIWDVSSGEYLQTLKGHSHSVSSVAFSHDSARLASASDDKTVKIWDVSSGECLQTFGTIVINTYDASTSNITPSVTGSQTPQYQGGALSSDGA